MTPLVVGFDLDLTLIDSRLGIAATYRELSARTGVFIDVDAAIHRLGPPLEVELAMWFPADEVDIMGAYYRRLYPDHAILATPALPGAAEAFAAVREHAGKIVVITGKYAPNAHLHLDQLGLVADAVIGWAWADTKTEAMLDHEVVAYLGDHPADMTAAVGAGAVAVGVGTGDHTDAELLAHGASIVLPDLTDFPAWLRERADLGWVGTDGSLAW